MAWQLLQKGTAVDETSASSGITFPGACTPGSVLLSAVRLGSTSTNPALSDGTNGSWNRRIYVGWAGPINDFAVFEKVNTGNTALTGTLTSSNATRRWNIYEFINTGRLHSFDKESSVAEGTSTSAVSGAITPAEDDELLFGAAGINGSASTTGANGLTLEDDIVNKIGIGWKVIATPVSSTADFTLGTSDTWCCGAILVKASPVFARIPFLGSFGRSRTRYAI